MAEVTQTTIRNPQSTGCHGGHCKLVITFDRHHVVHQSEGGPDTAENLEILCPNEHRNQHDLDDLFDRYQGAVPPAQLRQFRRSVQQRAKRRWARLHAG